MVMQTEGLAPPVGFRKAIPPILKLKVVLRQDGNCAACGAKLGRIEQIQFDHRPPLQMRCWDAEQNDTVPPANDETSIQAIHDDCHAIRTTGRKGESRLSKVGGDVSEIAKTKRLTRDQEEFRQRLLAKDDQDPEELKQPKRDRAKPRWPKRSFKTKER